MSYIEIKIKVADWDEAEDIKSVLEAAEEENELDFAFDLSANEIKE